MATTLFNDLVTFSRGTNATVVGPNGLIQWAPNNVTTFSEQFDSVAWQKITGGTGLAPVVTANVAVAPDGTTTADLIVFDRGAGNTATDRSIVVQAPTVVSATAYTGTLYVKAATAGDVGKQLAFRGVAGTGYQTVTLTASWVRISGTETSFSTAGNFEFGSRGTISSSNQVSAHIWGAQLELGSTATAYNPTTVKNLLGFSEAFDNAVWTKNNASIVMGAQANPINGLFNAQKVMENTVNAWHGVRQATSTGLVGVFSFYVKAAERSRVWVAGDTPDFAFAVAVFNLATGTVQSGTGSIQSAGNGWWRCSIPVTVSARGCTVSVANDIGAAIYTGDGNSGVYIWGAQLSDSASLDAYVPTPGAAPTSTAYYGPRFDYDPVTLAPRGLLIEEARTNLNTQSDVASSWNLLGTATVAANTGIAPDGTNNAFTLTNATDVLAPTGGNNIFKAATVSSSTAYTFSVYVKALTATTVSVNVFDGSTGGNTTQAIALTNAWQRVQVTRTSGASTTGMRYIVGAANGTVLVWGAQFEAGAFATSYIPTVGSTALRSADVATLTGSNFSGWYSQPEGTFVVDAFIPPQVDGGSGNYYFSASNGGAVDVITAFDANGTRGEVVTGGTTEFVSVVGPEPTSAVKMALAYSATSTIFAVNGALGTEDGTVIIPTVNRLILGMRGDSSGVTIANGHLRSIAYFNNRLSNAQLQALTAPPLITSLSLDFINNLYEG
jgi:hypothetical protein